MNKPREHVNMFREHVNEAVRDHIVRPIPDPVKQRVLTLWLNGSTYREIGAQTGLAIASISNIIADYRKRMPDLEDLRRLRSDLKEAKATLGEAMRGARLLKRLDELDFEREDLSACLKFVSTAGKRVSELASAGSRLLTLEQQTGKTYDRIVVEFEAKSKAEAALQRIKADFESRRLLGTITSLIEDGAASKGHQTVAEAMVAILRNSHMAVSLSR